MKSFFVPVFDFILRFTCYNCWQRTIAMILIIDGWLSVLCSEQDTICFHAQLMSIYAVIFFLQCFIFFHLSPRALVSTLSLQCNPCIGDLDGPLSRSALFSEVTPRTLDQMMPVHHLSNLPLSLAMPVHVLFSMRS